MFFEKFDSLKCFSQIPREHEFAISWRISNNWWRISFSYLWRHSSKSVWRKHRESDGNCSIMWTIISFCRFYGKSRKDAVGYFIHTRAMDNFPRGNKWWNAWERKFNLLFNNNSKITVKSLRHIRLINFACLFSKNSFKICRCSCKNRSSMNSSWISTTSLSTNNSFEIPLHLMMLQHFHWKIVKDKYTISFKNLQRSWHFLRKKIFSFFNKNLSWNWARSNFRIAFGKKTVMPLKIVSNFYFYF